MPVLIYERGHLVRGRPRFSCTEGTITVNPNDLFDTIAAALSPTGATAGVMFGKRALKVDGQAFACLKDNDLAFRLGQSTPEHVEALDLRGAHLFDPSGKGRPFKDWVAIPIDHAHEWPRLARVALERVVS